MLLHNVKRLVKANSLVVLSREMPEARATHPMEVMLVKAVIKPMEPIRKIANATEVRVEARERPQEDTHHEISKMGRLPNRSTPALVLRLRFPFFR